MSSTKQLICALKEKQDLSSPVYRALCILTTPQLALKFNYVKKDNTLLLPDDPPKVFPLPQGLEQIPDGHLFPQTFKNNNLFSRDITAQIKIAAKGTDVPEDVLTASKIRALFDVPDDGQCRYKVDLSAIKPFSLSESKFDPDVEQVLQSYQLYVNTNDSRYPFFQVKLPNATISYGVYRFIGQLPLWIRTPSGWKLPTVDHIGRDPGNNQRKSLRYCTSTQNQYNKCNKTKQGECLYHGVTEGGQFGLTLDKSIYCNEQVFNLTRSLANNWPQALKHFESIPAPPVTYLSDTPCKPLTPVMTHPSAANLLNTFIHEVLQHIESPKPYTPLLKWLDDRISPLDRQCANIRPIHFAALAYDILTLYSKGEYSHTNFLRQPPPKHTLESLGITCELRPEEVLNQYLSYYTAEELDSFLETFGLPKGKSVRFVATDSTPKEIEIVLEPRSEDYTPSSLSLHRLRANESILSPMTLYKD
jgi:hypothetical protein